MSTAIILFEDHTAQDFRPASWSVPVYEIGCGLFNLRERVGLMAEKDPELKVGLLPRGDLLDLQNVALPDGMVAGPDACAALCAASDRSIWIAARWAGSWQNLREQTAKGSASVALADTRGPLLLDVEGEAAADLVKDWSRWDREKRESPAVYDPTHRIPAWVPPLELKTDHETVGWSYLWDRVPAIGEAIADDVAEVIAGGRAYRRWIFGCRPEQGEDPIWARPASCRHLDRERFANTYLVGGRGVWVAEDVRIDPGVVMDVSHGPIVLERGARVGPGAVLAGPMALGAGAVIKAHACVGGEVVIGAIAKVSGEIAESQFAPYSNKQHAGFIGHAVLSSWVNLGADTTCSDLKNNYGTIKVNFGQGPVDTGQRFIGLMMAEHAKSAIGTTFNTATTVGFSANVFAPGFPRAVIPNFSWGDGRGKTYQVERALETARIVMGRRGVEFTPAHETLFRRLAREET